MDATPNPNIRDPDPNTKKLDTQQKHSSTTLSTFFDDVLQDTKKLNPTEPKSRGKGRRNPVLG